VSKDRAKPFSRKHRRYWLPVTGGMLLIGAINVAIGMCTYDPPSAPPEKIELNLTRDASPTIVDTADAPAAP
jgi:hypothetical protein